MNMLQFFIGFTLAILVSLAAYRAHTLNRSGAVGAALLGTIFFGLGGLTWSILLLTFFITSSLLSKVFSKRKASLDEKFSKGSQRDILQVFANGGIAGIFVLLNLAFPNQAWTWLGCAGALAAANADTWATELGVLSKSAPRLILNGKTVERGTSGGISLTGTLAALTGSALLGLLAALLWPGNSLLTALLWILGVSLAGLLGSLIDSALGASLQAIYYCPTCKKETERHPTHLCGASTSQIRGLPWMNNDWVNTFCTLAGAAFSVLAALIL